MAVANRSDAGLNYATRSNTSVTAPASIVDGDLLLLFLVLGAASPPTPTPPAGFLPFPGFTQGYSVAFDITLDHYCWYKIASGESGAYVVTHASCSSSAFIAAYSGVDSGDPGHAGVSDAQGTGTTTTVPGLTTIADGSLLVFFNQSWGSGAANITAPGGFTEQFEDSSHILYAADMAQATAGPTGAVSTTNSSASSEPWGAHLIALNPPLAGQFLRPDADLATTGWSTAPLFSKINDQSDATVITGALS